MRTLQLQVAALSRIPTPKGPIVSTAGNRRPLRDSQRNPDHRSSSWAACRKDIVAARFAASLLVALSQRHSLCVVGAPEGDGERDRGDLVAPGHRGKFNAIERPLRTRSRERLAVNEPAYL